MVQTEEALVKMFVDHLSHRGLAWIHRFAEAGHPLFDNKKPYHRYINDRFELFGGGTPAMSKEIGHDQTREKKTDVLLESRDNGTIGLWLVWDEDTWAIQKWVYGYTTANSKMGYPTMTDGVRAWIEGDYQLYKVDGVYYDD